MDKRTHKEMHSAKLRRSIVFRLAVLALFVLYCMGLATLREDFTSPPNMVRAIAVAAVASVLALSCLLAALWPLGVYYRWNDQEIRYVSLWRERFAMQWDEVVQISGIQAPWVEFSYVLKDRKGRRLKVDISHIGDESPLYALMKKQCPLLDDDKGVSDAGTMNFPTGRRRECHVVCDDWLAYRSYREIRAIRLSAIDQVHQYSEDPARELERFLSRLTGTTTHTVETGEADDIRATKLIVGARTRLVITSRMRDYDALLDQLRRRARNATWVNMNGPEPETNVERAVYWSHKVELCRSMQRSVWGFAGVLAVIVFAITAVLVRFGRDIPAGFRPSLAQVGVALGLVFITVILWRAGKTARVVAKLQKYFESNLAPVEAAKDTEVGSE